MRLENWTKNALGREIPTRIAGRDFRPFAGSFAEMPEDAAHAARIPRRPFDGSSKVTTFETAFDVLRDGDAVSFPHYYRTGGDRFLRAVVGELRRRNLKGIRLIGNAYFGELDYLVEAVKDDTIAYVYGDPYGGLAKAAGGGALLPVSMEQRKEQRKLATAAASATSCSGSSRSAWRSSPRRRPTFGGMPPACSASALSCADRSVSSTRTSATPTTRACAPAPCSTAS